MYSIDVGKRKILTKDRVVYAPAHMRGEPTDLRDIEKAPKNEVRVVTSHEPWQRYRVLRTGQRIKIKLSIDEVYRLVDKFDSLYMPVYSIPSGLAINVAEPESKIQGQ